MIDKIKKKAVFLDRDGTVIHDVGHINDCSRVKLFADTLPALRALQQDYELFVVTNQSGVSKGLITSEDVRKVNHYLDELFRDAGIVIRKWYVCPHDRTDRCECSKPSPFFLKQAASDYGLDLSRSFVIGDHPHDLDTADNAGAFGLYVLTGHGVKHLPELALDKLVFHGIRDAVDWIMTHPEPVADLRREVETGAEGIRNGKLVAFPTETVYGLGANAFNARAVAEIFTVKARPSFNPLIVHIADAEDLKQLAVDVPRQALRLAKALWPGPLTLVLPKTEKVPDIVTAGKSTVAVRMPQNPIALDIIRQAGVPVAAPSANKFGYTSPTEAAHVREQLGDAAPLIVNGGACRIGVESTVVSLTGGKPVILRPGGVCSKTLEEIVDELVEQGETCSESEIAPDSPGMMASHYAPETSLYLVDDINGLELDDVTGFLLFTPDDNFNVADRRDRRVEILSQNADPAEAAVNLYAAIRRLDSLRLQRIIAQRLPEEGLGKAVNDRLRKAAAGATDRRLQAGDLGKMWGG